MSPAPRAVLHLISPPPPAHLAMYIPRREYPAGTELCRSHGHGRGPWWFSNSGEGRFDLGDPDGTCYAAESELVTLLEAWGGMRVVPSYLAAQRDLSQLRLNNGVRVADLTSNLAVLHGITSEIFTTTDYPLTQLWASAFRRAGFDGIRYWARQDLAHTAGCLALFGAAGALPPNGFEVISTDNVSNLGGLLDQLEDETGIAVLPVPPI